MKKLFITLLAITVVGSFSKAQDVITLSNDLSSAISEPITSSQARGVVISTADQKTMTDKLTLFKNGLENYKEQDQAEMQRISDSFKLAFKESKFFEIQNSYFSGAETIEDIKAKCLAGVMEDRPLDEIQYFIFVSYSLQILEDYQISNPDTAGKRKPCTALQYLEAAAVGFVFCGPWCGTATLLLVAFNGC